jgi:hypothetical protein
VCSSGAFDCTPSDRHGFVRISTKNPYRFQYDDGTAFYPIGAQQGGLLKVGHDGPDADGKWRNVPLEDVLKDFDGAVNLNRYPISAGKPNGMSVSLIPEKGPPDRYDLAVAKDLDTAFALRHKYRVAQMLTLFQDMSLNKNFISAFGDIKDTVNYKSVTAANLALQEKYLRYQVARFAAYVDIWELFNEDSFAPPNYLAHLAKVVREADPYKHPITTNYERPEQAWCEIVCPHEYMTVPANETDGHMVNDFVRLKSFGKPVQYTEFGNKVMFSNDEPDKWRIMVWTAFTREVHMLFWSQSGSKSFPKDAKSMANCNVYLGPETREHFRILRRYSEDLPVTMRPIFTGWGNRDHEVRVGGVGDADHALIYLHHFTDHEQEVQPKPLYVRTTPGTFRLRWIDPASGNMVKEETMSTHMEILAIESPPTLIIDLALRIDRVADALEPPAPVALPAKVD